jgi:hypothetical protein
MASQRQLESARRNGALSRGPVTPEGREKSSRNSLVHGLSAKKIFVLQNESSEDFQDLIAAFIRQYEPATEVEEELCLAIAHAHGRIRRLNIVETGLFDKQMDRQDQELREAYATFDEGVRLASAFESLAKQNGALGLLTRYEGRVYRTLQTLVGRLETIQRERRKKCQNEPDSDGPAEPAANAA